MSYPELRRGAKGDEVKRLQSLLNRVGAMLVPDGDFGSGTVRGVCYGQKCAGQPESGIADRNLWLWLEERPEPFPSLATNGVALIAREETGGLAYYDQVCRWPHYPGEASGITIGIGFDLRFNSEDGFREAWEPHLAPAALEALSSDIGRPGTKKRTAELKRMGIEIPFKAAWSVFIDKTLPRFYLETQGIYPSLPRLPELCRAVLVSIVYNRGTGLSGAKRREMASIRDILAEADDSSLTMTRRKEILIEVEDQIVAMQRLWSPGSGLCKRRQAEANLWREGLAGW
ncbi:MAG: hypothetical protein BM485_07520 [Desulfobulbaceae bacterium DB1]|nr:MAG: hypothetical protein BM485_07520 [Desulfobulbaceae bacterium DB1]